MIVISDTSPLSALLRINRLELLEQVFQKVIIPSMVLTELKELEDFGFDTAIFENLPWLEIQTVHNQSLVIALLPRLDPGESEAIALADEISADFILMDEKEGRLVAQEKGLKVIGLLGVLSLAKKRKLITAIKPILDELIATGNFWIGKAFYRQFLQSQGE